jgi:hypothetical protein
MNLLEAISESRCTLKYVYAPGSIQEELDRIHSQTDLCIRAPSALVSCSPAIAPVFHILHGEEPAGNECLRLHLSRTQLSIQ